MRYQNRAFIIFLLLTALLLAGCNMKPVEVKEIGGIDIQNISNNVITLKISATIYNPNPRLTIKKSDVLVFMKDKELGTISLLDKIVLNGKTTGKYSALLKVELTSMKNGGIMSALSLFNGKKQELKLNGKIKVTAPFYWKTIHLKDYPVKL